MPNLPRIRQKSSSAAIAHNPSAQSLAQAFTAFKEAAGSLETSYLQLQTEIAALRRELQERNRDLAQSLQENERIRAYLGRILEALPCGVLVLNGFGRVQIANPAALRLLSADSPSTIETLQVPESIRCAETGIEQSWDFEAADGIVHLAATRAVLPAGFGSAEDSVFILRDITDEKRLEEAREAAQRVQALAEMSMLLAHEIRNPLASMELFAGLLAEATEGHGEPRIWVDHLQAGLRGLAATVNNVLQFHSQPAPQPVPRNLRLLLSHTVDFLAPLARQSGMTIELAECDPELYLQADPHRLQQVFLNLGLNAFRVMPAGGRASVSGRALARGDRNWVEVVFQDDGPGIPPGQLDAIFQPGVSTNPGSPGLGLAVSKKIVEQHGGVIYAENAPEGGARFHLEFPVAGAER